MVSPADISRAYKAQLKGRTELLKICRALNFTLAASSLVMGSLFWGPREFFWRPTSPPYPWWVSFNSGSFELWDFVFPIGAIFLFFATVFGKRLFSAHVLLAVSWFTIGLAWAIHGIVFPPTAFFGIGILSIFFGAFHLLAIRLWSVERSG